MNYSTIYKNIDKRAIEATKKLVKGGFWKQNSQAHKIELCKKWLEEVSEIYGVEVPNFKFDESEVMYRQTGGGQYVHLGKEIFLFHKFSLVTLLHEFRHYLQFEKGVKMYKGDYEEDARAWSCSLFKSSTPKAYANAVSKGIMHFN